MATARIVGDKPYFSRNKLNHDYVPYDGEKIRSEIKYLSYYGRNRDASNKTEGKTHIFDSRLEPFSIPTILSILITNYSM